MCLGGALTLIPCFRCVVTVRSGLFRCCLGHDRSLFAAEFSSESIRERRRKLLPAARLLQCRRTMPVIPAALVVVILGGFFLFRRADVRLVLMLAAAALFLVRATQPEVAGARWNAFAQFFSEFAKQMVSPASVIPICSAMGFAYVCKLTGCDAHLVHLLCTPLRYVRWLLIPGGIAIAFFVNSAIVSQTSTVSVVGPVLIPLLIGAGVSRQTAGALLLLGGSMGGELLNPAAVEVAAISKVTGVNNLEIIRHLLPYNLLASGTAMIVFWGMAILHERRVRISPEK